jgi:hypothetical protein
VRREEKKRAKKLSRWGQISNRKTKTVGNYFDVHVGRVVPHRDPENGPKHPYIHPRCIEPWKTIREFKYKRRHQGKVYETPFVAIRRTSRPGHPYRAAATIIAGGNKIAVENHLIVCEPKDKKLSTCRKLMKQLKSKKVNDFLDASIRCRHLTIGSVSAIPFQP